MTALYIPSKRATIVVACYHPDYTDQLSFFSDWDFVDVERQCGPSCTALQVHEPGVTDLWVGTGPKNPAKWPKHEEKRRTRDEIHARHCPFMDAEVEREKGHADSTADTSEISG